MDLLAHICREHPEVAVLMVTGEDSTKLAMKAIELGAYGYLVKPVGSGELLINVANALHRWRADTENPETELQMLAGSATEVVRLGALIARIHHERLDGSGLPAWARRREHPG